MVVALHHDEFVRSEVLAGYVPRFSGTAQADALALTDRVESQTDVLADYMPFVVDHRPRRLRQVAIQELAERPLADKADAGRVLLSVIRQPRLEREAAHLALF